MNIYKIAKHLIKKHKGKITSEEMVLELEQHGYDTVFFNTTKGDMVLKAYGLEANNGKAFTYCGVTRIVFINEKASYQEKLFSLLHELGHVLLGHFNNTVVSPDVRISEMEAEAFAYIVLHPPKLNKKHVIVTMAISIVILLTGVFLGYTIPNYINTMANECVYITSTGTNFHRQSCIYVGEKYRESVLISEARKCFQPCLVCNP